MLYGTYVYCFGGIETLSTILAIFYLGTYVYCFGGIETKVMVSFINGPMGTYVYCFGGIETLLKKALKPS